jgi:hypothetical protein
MRKRMIFNCDGVSVSTASMERSPLMYAWAITMQYTPQFDPSVWRGFNTVVRWIGVSFVAWY